MIEFIKKHYGKIGMSFALVMLVINYFQRQELVKLRIEAGIHKEVGVPVEGDAKITHLIDSLEIENDSLTNLLFIERVDAGRHEITREEILGKYPKVAKEYDDFYTHQTE
jgi:hypothetical protein